MSYAPEEIPLVSAFHVARRTSQGPAPSNHILRSYNGRAMPQECCDPINTIATAEGIAKGNFDDILGKRH